jgi:hypothetical protein
MFGLMSGVDVQVLGFFERKLPHICLKRTKEVKRGWRKLFILYWRPRRDLNPCYRRERAILKKY